MRHRRAALSVLEKIALLAAVDMAVAEEVSLVTVGLSVHTDPLVIRDRLAHRDPLALMDLLATVSTVLMVAITPSLVRKTHSQE